MTCKRKVAGTKSLSRRKAVDFLVKVFSYLAALSGLTALAWILSVVFSRGVGAIDWSFLTRLPTPAGIQGGGLANAILGTLLLTVVGTAIGAPVGFLAGIYLAEFGKQSKFASCVRFTVNMLMGVPSIIIGLFIYALIVVSMGEFSGVAGAMALAVLVAPIVARATEDILSLVPNELRESSLALGNSRSRTVLAIVCRSAKGGLLTGVLLAVARISGETAPLLFTALNSPYWPQSLVQPTPNLTVTIFNYAMSPYPDWQRMAWGASLLICVGVLALTVVSRYILRQRLK